MMRIVFFDLAVDDAEILLSIGEQESAEIGTHGGSRKRGRGVISGRQKGVPGGESGLPGLIQVGDVGVLVGQHLNEGLLGGLRATGVENAVDQAEVVAVGGVVDSAGPG